MHGVDPSLVMGSGLPLAYDIVAVLIEFYVEADGVFGATTETMVFRMVEPGVDDFPHVVVCEAIIQVCICSISLEFRSSGVSVVQTLVLKAALSTVFFEVGSIV